MNQMSDGSVSGWQYRLVISEIGMEPFFFAATEVYSEILDLIAAEKRRRPASTVYTIERRWLTYSPWEAPHRDGIRLQRAAHHG